MTGMQDDDIDHLLAVAAKRPLAPTEALMDRVLADALALQPGPVAVHPAPRMSLLSRLAEAFGGTPALAGLCSAAVVGVAAGYLSPSTLDYLTGATPETVEFFPDTDFLQTEG
jgi:hypothetical protein